MVEASTRKDAGSGKEFGISGRLPHGAALGGPGHPAW